MAESNQEGYQTIGWIINKSEEGLFLVIANEDTQQEIAGIYGEGMVGVYDYKKHPANYSFKELYHWIVTLPGVQTFFILTFQFAVQNEEDLRRLNFSRDMLANLKKNLIFVTTPYGDDKLSTGAYDFYSFIKLRIQFEDQKPERIEETQIITEEPADFPEKELSAEEKRQVLDWAMERAKQAMEAYAEAKYPDSIRLWPKVIKIHENILGSEHPVTAISYNNLAGVYIAQGAYEKAEELYRKALRIREEVLGENHPSTATSYNNLAGVYEDQGAYEKAEELYQKALRIDEEVLGKDHPTTIIIRNNLQSLNQ